MRYLLALDQGTTSSRALLFNQQGSIHAVAQKEFKQYFPQPGWVEHDPMEIWSSQVGVMEEVLAKAGVTSKYVAAIGITNQRETTILWERKTGIPIAPAIVWQDRRTTELCQQFKQKGLETLFQEKTGLLLDPYFSGTKIHWLLHHVPGALEKARRGELAFGTVDSWLVWKLTEGACHVTDVTNASRTLIYNIHTLQWDQELLDILDIPREILPEVKSSSEVYGHATNSIVISGIAGDQQAALVGQGCLNSGMAKTTYGTGCFLLMNTGKKAVHSKNHLLTTIAYQIGTDVHYALEGSVFMGGAVVQWLRDNLGIIKTSQEIEALASTVSDNGGVYFIPAFTGLGAPHWDPYARGTLFGLTRGTTTGHIARAALEGIAHQVVDVLKAMEQDAQTAIKELRVDGGAVKDNLLMQIQADLLEIPVLRPKVSELTALGAAYLAGLSVDFWPKDTEITSFWQLERTFVPQLSQEDLHRKTIKWKNAIQLMQQWKDRPL